MEEDVVGLQRVVLGNGMAVCDLCGQAVAAVSIERIQGARSAAEPVEVLHVCRSCREQIERGEGPLDVELAPGWDRTDDQDEARS
jgi:hypothetical protein